MLSLSRIVGTADAIDVMVLVPSGVRGSFLWRVGIHMRRAPTEPLGL